MKKIYVSWHDVQRQCQELVRQMWLDRWVTDYVVGITRGGLTPAVLISQYLDRPMHTLRVSLRDSDTACESNCWMVEDAVDLKNILIVDDINDSGATLNWICDDWNIAAGWGKNVRVAVLYNNESSHSTHAPDYVAEVINKFENPCWIVFPWEEWWRRWNPEEQHQ